MSVEKEAAVKASIRELIVRRTNYLVVDFKICGGRWLGYLMGSGWVSVTSLLDRTESLHDNVMLDQ